MADADYPTKKRTYRETPSWEEAQRRLEKEIQKRIELRDRRGLRPDRRRRPWNPVLLIQAFDGDNAARALPTGQEFWLSPDITVQSGDPFHRIIAGQENFVVSTIWNLGRMYAAPVMVEYFWANPSLGLGPGNMVPISKDKPEWVEVPPLSAVPVVCQQPWIPVFENDGHECLFVNCHSHIYDPIQHPFQPSLDRHSAQRNVTVKQMPAGAMFGFHLDLNNVFPHASGATVMFRTAHLAVNGVIEGATRFNEAIAKVVAYGSTPQTLRAPQTGAAEARPPVAAPHDAVQSRQLSVRSIQREAGRMSMRSSIDERSAIVPYAHADRFVGQMFLGRERSARTLSMSNGSLLHDLSMRPFEQRRLALEIEVPASARPGEFVVYHFTQLNDGFTSGGYALVVHVVDTPTRPAEQPEFA